MTDELKEKVNENMSLWNEVCDTPKGWAGDAKINGRKIKTVDAQLIKKWATQLFGPIGIGWGTLDEHYVEIIIPELTLGMVRYNATLFYTWKGKVAKTGITSAEKLLYKANSGRIIFDDEASKKAQTNAISKGFANGGMCSDIYEGVYDGDKWMNRELLEGEKGNESSPPAEPKAHRPSHSKEDPPKREALQPTMDELVLSYKNAYIATLDFLGVPKADINDILSRAGLIMDHDWDRVELNKAIRVLRDEYQNEIARRENGNAS